MDCINAQAAISEALDRSPVEAAVLDEAKAHCKTCPTCGAFVRTLSAAKRSPLPEPPHDLADRIMTAVRAEAFSAQIARNAAAAQESAVALHQTANESESVNGTAVGNKVQRGVRNIFAPRNRRQLMVWASAAAVLVVVAGVATVNGVRMITGVTTPQSDVRVMDAAGSSGSPMSAVPPSPNSESKAATDAGSSQRSYGTAADKAAGSGVTFVSISGGVFRASGPAAVSKTDLHQAGSASVVLSSAGEAKSRPVYVGADPSRVFLEDDSGTLIAFDRVVRVFRGTTYQQQSSAITLFEAWPTLPAQITAPTTPDGSPELVLEGTDDAGVKVYRLASSGALTGIGVAPVTASTDPAAGNPNWTWWTPVR